MTRFKPWPRSLAGQMALLIALALLVAQVINFGMILHDRSEFRLAQATRPVATRIADALDREAHGGRALSAERGRVRRLPTNPIPPAMFERHPEVEAAYTVAGDASAMLRVRARDTAHLEETLERIRDHPGVTRTQTQIVLSTLFERPFEEPPQT